jgi:hypothetical protein
MTQYSNYIVGTGLPVAPEGWYSGALSSTGTTGSVFFNQCILPQFTVMTSHEQIYAEEMQI